VLSGLRSGKAAEAVGNNHGKPAKLRQAFSFMAWEFFARQAGPSPEKTSVETVLHVSTLVFSTPPELRER
jgi:hypothetical protein